MSTHYLYNKSPRMGCSCGADVVDGFTYPVQGSWSADSKVSHGHVVVDGAHKSDDFQMTMISCLLFSNLAYSAIINRRNSVNNLLHHLESANLRRAWAIQT